MADLLEGASAWLDAQRLKFMSRTVSYCHGKDSVDVRAAVGKTVFEVDSGYAVLERIAAPITAALGADGHGRYASSSTFQ